MHLDINEEDLVECTLSLHHVSIFDTCISPTCIKEWHTSLKSKALNTVPILLLNKYKPENGVVRKYMNLKHSSQNEVDRNWMVELQQCMHVCYFSNSL